MRTPFVLLALVASAFLMPVASAAPDCVGGGYNPGAVANVCTESYTKTQTTYQYQVTPTGGPVCVVGYTCPDVERVPVGESKSKEARVFVEATLLCSLGMYNCGVTIDTGNLLPDAS